MLTGVCLFTFSVAKGDSFMIVSLHDLAHSDQDDSHGRAIDRRNIYWAH